MAEARASDGREPVKWGDPTLPQENVADRDDWFTSLAARKDLLSDVNRLLDNRDDFATQNGATPPRPANDESLDPSLAAVSALVDPVSHPSDGPKAKPHQAAPPTGNGLPSNPPNLAGAGQGPGGTSTPFAPGGGSSSGGGGGNAVGDHLAQLGNHGAFDNLARTNAATQGPLDGRHGSVGAAAPSVPTVPAAPLSSVSNDRGEDRAKPINAHPPHAPKHGLSVQPANGPTIGDPPISASEGVAWNGTVASVTDNDGDGTSGFESITGTINWGDGNTSPFFASVPEGGSGSVMGSHTWTEKGTYTVTITANDADGGQSQATETATVTDAALTWLNGNNAPNYPPTWSQTLHAPPTITAPASQTNTEGDTVSLQVQASDHDGDTLSYDALDLPPGLSINAGTGLISGTVAYGAAEDFGGSYNPTILVDDGQGGSAQTSFAWTIGQAQVAPTLTNPGNQTNLRGDNVSLQINATQVDGDPISYDASNLPTGLYIDSGTGIISGSVDPSSTLGVLYAVTVTATDVTTNLSASQSFNWTINATNVAPVLTSPGAQTNAAGDFVSLPLTATDADGDTLTYTAIGLPPGPTLDPVMGVISGTLPNSAASSTPYNVTVTASDGLSSSSQTFTWTINAVSLQSPGDQSNLDGDNVSLQLSATDAAGLSLTYNAQNLPPGLTINNTTGLISGTLNTTDDSSSPYAVTVTATDSANNSASQMFNWTVARLALNNPGDQENQEGTSVSLQLSASDNEGTPTYSANGLPPGLSISSSGLISGTIGTAAHGSSPYQVTVTAADGGATSIQSFVWTVTPRVALVNPGPLSNAVGDSVSLQLSATSPGGTMTYSASDLPPGLTISSSGLISGTPTTASSMPYNVTVTAYDGTSSSSQTFAWTVSAINLVSPGAQSNNDGDAVSLSLTTGYHGAGTLSYSANGSLPPGLSLNTQTGQITGTIASTADTNSPYSVTVTVTDGTDTSSQTFNWTVNAVVSVDPIDDQSNSAGDTVSLQVSAGDALNGTLTYSATGLPSGLTINSTTGLISGTIATGADSGSPYAVTVTATDSAGLSATQTFNWAVAHVSLVNPGPLLSADGQAVSFQMQGGDTDGDTVTYTATGLPSDLSISNNGLISGTLASNADTNSPYNVTVTATDTSGHSTSQTFLWTVAQVSLGLPSDQTNTEGDVVSLQLQGLASSGSLTYSASGLPDGLSLNTTTGLISGTIAPGAAVDGPFTVDISASNGVVSTSQSFNWNVNPVVNLTLPADQSNTEGDNVSLQMAATDTLGHTLTYSADGLPSGLSINSTTGLISGTITAGDAASGPYAVTVTAGDGTYSNSLTFGWNVTHTDTTSLTMTNPGTQSNVAGDSVNLQVNASDPDGMDTLFYSATSLPDGLDIDPFSGIISGTVADDAVSNTPYAVTVTADDGNGQTVSQTFNWLVNDAPITAQASPVSAVEGNDTGAITVAAFTTPNLNAQAGEYTAVVNWGDGSSADLAGVSGGNGSFTVTDDHSYAEKGSYPVSVTITDSAGNSTTVTSTMTVADAALHLTGGLQLGDAMSNPQSSFALASFSDDNPSAPMSDYSVLIDWGDGSPPTNMTSLLQNAGDGTYIVVGSHSYANPLNNTQLGPVTYTVTVTVTDADGASASTTSTIVVGQLEAGVPATMGGWIFQDQNTYAKASDFVANGQTGVGLINWGDGTSSVGTVTGGPGNGSGPVQFFVQGTHTYAQDSYDQPNGKYTITVTVTDTDGGTLTGTQYVSVVRPPMGGNGDEVEGQPGVALNNVQVAEFTVPDTTDGVGEVSATVDWGDGSTPSVGAIQEVAPGLFEVLGGHTYAVAGPYSIQVDVSQDWNSSLFAMTTTSTAVIGAAPQISGISVVPGNSVYRFTVPIPPTTDERKADLGDFTVDNFNAARIVEQGWLYTQKDGVITYTGFYAFVQFDNEPVTVNIGLKNTKVNGVAFNPAPAQVTVIQVIITNPSRLKAFNSGAIVNVPGIVAVPGMPSWTSGEKLAKTTLPARASQLTVPADRRAWYLSMVGVEWAANVELNSTARL
ncbi:MAG TPA: putative Ig domain-containing protein [Gemmataceae bacterium]|jgi:hypothetical protein